eukprot:TRINITY_DN863_c0_g1_i1.p1 TRINITY_DN863_c0_g1~~TRINITY_DN863_c0_g1_i1.p1  ORF type:complete len:435 (-),score=51.68 TRINITY_DN863_c0_g1_i1:29-1333(-)
MNCNSCPAPSTSSCLSRTSPSLVPAKRKADGSLRCPRQSFWNIRCACVFSYVPDALVINNMFTYLTHTELAALGPVCKRWRFLSSSHVLWKQFELAALPHSLAESEPSLMYLLIKHSESIQALKLCEGPQLSASTLAVLPRLTKLRSVHLCNLIAVEDQLVRDLLLGCPALTELYLGGCSNVTDAAFEVVPSLGRSLNVVTVRGCRGLSHRFWDFMSGAVAKLNLAECSQVCVNFNPLSMLKFVSLDSINLHGVDVGDEFLDALCGVAKSITQLAISSANPFLGNRVTDNGLKSISGLTQLRDLNIMGARHITDQGVFFLSLSCASLIRLSIGFCVKVTDAGISYIGRGLTNLTHLGIFQCPLVTDFGISLLADSSGNLQFLDVRGCISLTSNSIDCFIRAFPRLQVLSAGLCRGISESDFELLRRQRQIEVIG